MPHVIATNRKAFRDFEIVDFFECGLVLKGSEVKSIREGKVDFKGSFARIENGEIFAYNLHIDPYLQAGAFKEEPDRKRKLLLNKKEIAKIYTKFAEKNLALVPTKIYFNPRGWVKLELGLGRGKKLFDKRETIKKRDIDRALRRTLHQPRKSKR